MLVGLARRRSDPEQLYCALANNHTILDVDLTGNTIAPSHTKMIADHLAFNREVASGGKRINEGQASRSPYRSFVRLSGRRVASRSRLGCHHHEA